MNEQLAQALNQIADLTVKVNVLNTRNERQSKGSHKGISKVRHIKRNSRPKKEETVIMDMAGNIVVKVGD